MTSKQKSYLQKRLTEIADKKINAINLLHYKTPTISKLIEEDILVLTSREDVLNKIPADAVIDRYSHVNITTFFVNYEEQLELNKTKEDAWRKSKSTRIDNINKELHRICDQIMFCNDAEALAAIGSFESMEF